MQKPDVQIGAEDFELVTDKDFALVGVECFGKSTTRKGLAQAV